jgi:hypothetical protein
MMQKTLLVTILLTMIFGACSPGGSNVEPAPTPTKGKIELKLTDDPGTFAYFRIDLMSVEYNESNDPQITTGWVNIPLTNPGIIDIIQFSNGREMPLGSLEALPVTVKQLRLKLGTRNSFAVWSLFVGGTFAFFDMAVHPSIANGLVVPCTVKMTAGGVNRLYLDFDASRSRVQIASTTWLLLPSVRIFEAGLSSAIEGHVLPKEAKPFVRVIYLNHNSPLDYTDTAYGYPDEVGYFKIIGLPTDKAIPDSVAGIQKVEFLPRMPVFPPYQPQEKDVQLIKNVTVNTGTTVLVQ